MKPLNKLLEGRPARPGQAGSPGEAAAREAPGRDHVDAINQLFAQLELAYHNQFHKAYAQEGSLALAKKYWLSRLCGFPPRVILAAAHQVVGAQEFLPTLPVMVKACEDAVGLFGLPAPRDAYLEACRAPEPKAAYAWSHPAVYHAGRATEWFVLANEPESRAFPLFEYHYRVLCRRVMEGERLDIELPRALPERPAKTLDASENKARLRALREKLKL